MNVLKVVLHIDEINKWQMVLNNAQNLINGAANKKYDIRIIVNGNAVNLFGQESDSNILKQVDALTKQKTEVFLCRNALQGNGINEVELPSNVSVVPAGIIKLVELEMAGYAYIKP